MRRFDKWIEETQDFNSKTIVYAAPISQSNSTGDNAGDITRMSGDISTRNADPVISQHIESLKEIQAKLGSIFSDLQNRIDAFKNAKIKAAFERELRTGVDSISRSHLLLSPRQGVE
jgi:hypothetical protein